MVELSEILAIALAAVLAVAAVTKLRDRAGAGESAAALGVPTGVAGLAASAAAVIELGVAVGLVVPGSAHAAAIVALSLLGVFSAVVALNLARGSRPACHCFGTVSSAPIGPRTLVRNGVLAAVAAWLAVDPAVSTALPVDLASFAAGAGLAAAIALPLVIVLLRRHGRALARGDVLEAELAANGIAADAVLGTGVAGHPAPAALIRHDRTVLALFTAPGCEACAEVEERLPAWRAAHAGQIEFLTLDLESHREDARECGVTATPAAVVVAPDGRIAREPQHGVAAIEALLAAPAPGSGSRPRADHLPPDLVGPLERRRSTLVVLWDPACGFCTAMADQIESLRADPSGPAVLVISADADRRRLADALGAPGTPTGVLVAPDGAVLSDLAVGSGAIMALARAPSGPEIVHVEATGAR